MRAVNVEMSRKSKVFLVVCSLLFFFTEQIPKTGSKPFFYGKRLNL